MGPIGKYSTVNLCVKANERTTPSGHWTESISGLHQSLERAPYSAVEVKLQPRVIEMFL